MLRRLLAGFSTRVTETLSEVEWVVVVWYTVVEVDLGRLMMYFIGNEKRSMEER